MPDNGDFVTIYNRTSRPLEYQMDGRIYPLAPGPNERPWEHVRYAKNQNPLMGSADPFSTQVGYLVGARWKVGGVEEGKDPIDPIEQSSAIELLDHGDNPNVVHVQTRHINSRISANRDLRADERVDTLPSAKLSPPPAKAPIATAPDPLKAQISELLANSKGMNKATLAKRLEELAGQ